MQTQLAAMRTRGAVEDFVPNPELLEEGKVKVEITMQHVYPPVQMSACVQLPRDPETCVHSM